MTDVRLASIGLVTLFLAVSAVAEPTDVRLLLADACIVSLLVALLAHDLRR